jgi:ferredoxin
MTITFHIDGREISATPGQTVLEAARKNGIHIPTICYHPALKPSGSCKMCAVLVENIAGHPMTMLSCVLKVKAGLVIQSDGPEVREARAQALTRLIQLAPQSRRLRDLAAAASIELPPPPDGCIQCRLCVRVCKEIVGQEALRMEKQAGQLHVVANPGKCIGCGTCANLCPMHVIDVIDNGPLRIVRKGDMVFGQQPLERCEGCGKYYATEQHVHLVEERTRPHPQVKLHHHYCPACAKLFSDRLQVMKKQPPRQKFNKGRG